MMLKAVKRNNIALAPAASCTGCAACVSACPRRCITMREDREGFLQPHIDTALCVACHKCERTCPILNPVTIPQEPVTRAYAAINRDNDIRMQSSSGGVFYALAKWTIEQGGVVFGARFDDNWEVMHDYTETLEGIKPFMRSKYVQSRIGDTFVQAKQFLAQGRWVLYSGTPCQLGGLKAYLGKDYDRLITVDLICHGVPSPAVWRKYIKEVCKNDNILGINFRDKKKGWKGFMYSITTTKGIIRYENPLDNLYFRGFLIDVYLRRSCYHCAFKTLHRCTDFTIADHWGIQHCCPEIDDDKGVSLMLVHTVKGQHLLQSLQHTFLLKEQPLPDSIKWNWTMIESVPLKKNRAEFFLIWHFLPFPKMSFFINKDDLATRIKRKSRRIVTKLTNRIKVLGKSNIQ